MKRILPAVILALTVIALAAPLPATAQTKIRVVVNDTAITSYDINQRAKLLRLTERLGGAASRRKAQQELVEEVLKLAEAERLRSTVGDGEVNDAYASIARNVKMSPKQLSNALRQNGVNPSTLKDRLRAQLSWSRVVRRRFQAQVNVNESDVIAALKKSKDLDKEKSIEYQLRQVIVVVPKKSSSGFKSKRKREAQALRKRFTSCPEGVEIARGLSEVVVKNIGRRLETELPDGLRDDIEKTSVGRLTAPQTTGNGYEMIAVCEKREIASDVAARTELENELRAKEGEQLSRRYLSELRRRAVIDYR